MNRYRMFYELRVALEGGRALDKAKDLYSFKRSRSTACPSSSSFCSRLAQLRSDSKGKQH